MSMFEDVDRTSLKRRRVAVNAPHRVIARAYSSIVLQMHQRGITGPTARKNAILWTADVVSRMTGVEIAPQDVEAALAIGGTGQG